MFFDGTGNNREIDYLAAQNDPSQQKHSNVVRLLHTFRANKEGADKYYAGYVPGVGTPFKDISDTGGKMGRFIRTDAYGACAPAPACWSRGGC